MRAFLESFDSPERVINQLALLNSSFFLRFNELILLKVVHACGEATAHRLLSRGCSRNRFPQGEARRAASAATASNRNSIAGPNE